MDSRSPRLLWTMDFLVGGILGGLFGLTAEFDWTGFILGFVVLGSATTLTDYFVARRTGRKPWE